MAPAETETLHSTGLRVFHHRPWSSAFPGLSQGITGRGAARFGPPADARADTPDGWRRLSEMTGIERIAHCHQVHGATVAICDRALPVGVSTLGEADALVTAEDGHLIVVTVADCVPVFLVDPATRVVGLAHAGWRGSAAGVVEATLERMARLGAEPGSVYAHLGPAICGECYEVGPEVPAALGQPPGATHVDLREYLRGVLRAAGVPAGQATASAACTRCDAERFFSYRGGDRRRRMCAFLGWLPR